MLNIGYPLLHSFTNNNEMSYRQSGVIVRGEGVYVYDQDGKKYLEALSGLWSASLGFSNERIVDAARQQLATLPSYHCAIGRTSDVTLKLAQRLLEDAPSQYSKVFFVNSGSEATETAIKLLMYRDRYLGREWSKFLSRDKAYHGMTLAAASLNGVGTHKDAFGPATIDVARLSSPDAPHATVEWFVDELEKSIADQHDNSFSGMFLEPIMGAGGVVVPPEGYLPSMSKVLQKHSIPIVDDEVICGLFRCGVPWLGHSAGLKGSIMTSAKGLGGAFVPIGAVFVDEEIESIIKEQDAKFGVLQHGFTFGGHPVAAAIAMETLEIMNELELGKSMPAKEEQVQCALAQLKDKHLIMNPRGKGLLFAFDLIANAEHVAGARFASLAREFGLIVRGIGNSIVLCPPLVISSTEIDEMIDRLEQALRKFS